MTAKHMLKRARRWARRETGTGCEFLGRCAGAAQVDRDTWLRWEEFVLNSPPSKLFPACGHQNAVRSPARSRCLLSLLFPPPAPITHTHIHNPPFCLHFESSLTQTVRERRGGMGAVWLSELWCVCVCVAACIVVYACMCVCSLVLEPSGKV